MKNCCKTPKYLTALTSILLLAPSFCAAHPEPPKDLIRSFDEKFKKTDTDSDDLISKEEFQIMQQRRIEKRFAKIDLNKDNHLSKEEMEAFFKHMRALSANK